MIAKKAMKGGRVQPKAGKIQLSKKNQCTRHEHYTAPQNLVLSH